MQIIIEQIGDSGRITICHLSCGIVIPPLQIFRAIKIARKNENRPNFFANYLFLKITKIPQPNINSADNN